MNSNLEWRFSLSARLLVGVFSLLISFNSFSDTNPWRLKEALALPESLSIDVQHRTRYETLDSQYRAQINGVPGRGGDQALVFRTLFHAKVNLPGLRFGAELMDSRIALADSGSATGARGLTTTIANPVELLQAYVEMPIQDVFAEGSETLVRAGRITMDIGSRRLVARNRYRNTINGFTGIDMQWQHNNRQLRAFYTLPVHRRVNGAITDNEPRFDVEESDVRFWGVYFAQPLINQHHRAEFFLFNLDENNTRDRKTRRRQHYTFGGRAWKKTAPGQFDYQLETAIQIGRSKTSLSSTDTLKHRAHFHHAELGYQFDTDWSPRLVLQYDFASGDDNPNDQHNNRFDTLFGARRFDYGPTSIYGAFARSNLNSPGLRLQFKPHSTLDSMFALRGYLRASSDDTWTTAGINGRDLYIGTQIEARLRWNVIPDNILLETGFAHLFSGDLMDAADKSDVTYGYIQTVFKF